MGILNSKGLREIFVTKKLKVATGIASGTWAALSFLTAYALESAFASMQKKAGRLGVMKGLEELEDVEYYV